MTNKLAAIDFEAEQITDTRHQLSYWLLYAARESGELTNDLMRAHKHATTCEPVTAMVILPLIEQAAAIKAQLAMLVELRSEVKP